MPTRQREWKTTERDLVRRLYPDTETAEIAKTLGRSVKSVYQYAALMGLKKSSEFMHRPRGGK